MKLKYVFLLLFFTVAASCKKDFLQEKPDKHLVVPSSMKDLQALLDYAEIMNYWMPYLGELSSDDYYLSNTDWKSLTNAPQKNAYIWAKDIYDGTPSPDWSNMYSIVFYANNVLEGLEKLKDNNDPKTYNEIKGSALFFRGYAFYQLAQLFCAPFNAAGKNDGKGIAIRLESDINLPTVRATVQQTYMRVLEDLKLSADLLPEKVSIKTRPNKTAAFSMLSRVYLVMQDFDKSLKYADSALASPSYELMNLNDLNINSDFPIAQYNSEVIFQTSLNYASNLTSSYMNVDSTLYLSFRSDDLRKVVWFKNNQGRIVFKGNYNGASPYLFSGLALNEVLLNKAECLARTGKSSPAMDVLNMLLEKRFKSGNFSALTATTSNDAIEIILEERRKELLFRAVRWSDLRRLNIEPERAKTLYRILEGEVFELTANSPNYVFPIPDDVIKFSGIEQNMRY